MRRSMRLPALVVGFVALGGFVPPNTPKVPTLTGQPAAGNPYPGRVNNAVTRVMQNRATNIGVPSTSVQRVDTIRGLAASANKLMDARALVGAAGRVLGWMAVLQALPVAVNAILRLTDGTFVPPPGSIIPTQGVDLEDIGNATSLPSVPMAAQPMVLNAVFSINEPKAWKSNMPSAQGRPLKTCWGTTPLLAGKCVAEELQERERVRYPAAPPLGFKGTRDCGTGCVLVFHRGRHIELVPQSGNTAAYFRAVAEADIDILVSQDWRGAPRPTCPDGVAMDFGPQESDVCTQGITPNGPIHVPKNDAPYYVVGGQKDRPLSNQTVADLVNGLWQDASRQSGYTGLPFPQNAPVTADEVAASRAQSPSAWPTIGDLLAPVSPGAVTGSTVGAIQLPANGTQTALDPTYVADPASGVLPQVNTSGTPANLTGPVTVNQTVDLGPNPNIPLPADPATPTMASIVDPLFTWFPGLDVQIPAGECPTDQMTVLGETFVLDQHCAIFESQRALFSVIFLGLWTLSAAMIVLRA